MNDNDDTVTTITKEMVAEKHGELFRLMNPLRASNIPQQLGQYCVNKTGQKMAQYFSNPDPSKWAEQYEMANTLIDILQNQRWNVLPAAPNGQAVVPGATAPRPAPVVKVKEEEPEEKPQVPAPKPAPVKLPKAPVAPDEEDDTAPDPIDVMMKQLQALKQKKQPPGLTEDDVRRIAREVLRGEMLTFLKASIKVMENQGEEGEVS